MAEASDLTLDDATIGIITALPEEYTATCKAMACSVEVMAPGSGPGRRYSLASIPSLLGGRHVIAVTRLVIPGNNSAAIQAAKMAEQFRPRQIIMVGIAGAVPNPMKAEAHVRLGDIVMSGPQGVVQYDFDKETLDPPRRTTFFDRIFNLANSNHLERVQTTTEHRHFPRPPSAEILEAAYALENERKQGRFPWELRIAQVILELGEEMWGRPTSFRSKTASI